MLIRMVFGLLKVGLFQIVVGQKKISFYEFKISVFSSLIPIEAFLSGKYKIDDMIVLDLYSDLVRGFVVLYYFARNHTGIRLDSLKQKYSFYS